MGVSRFDRVPSGLQDGIIACSGGRTQIRPAGAISSNHKYRPVQGESRTESLDSLRAGLSEVLQMKDNRTNQRSVVVAAVVASAVMMALGIGYRAVAARLKAPVDTDPVTQETLGRLPLRIAEWQGQDVPMDADVIAATDTDACLSRRYEKEDGAKAVSLWVASGVQVRDLMPHRPEVCYVGNGYTLASQRVEELSPTSDLSFKCNVMGFSRGTDRVIVVYYYIVDGQYCQNVGQFRYRIRDRIGYVTQVQVVAAVRTPPGANAVEKTVFDFARDSAGPLLGLFQEPTDIEAAN